MKAVFLFLLEAARSGLTVGRAVFRVGSESLEIVLRLFIRRIPPR